MKRPLAASGLSFLFAASVFFSFGSAAAALAAFVVACGCAYLFLIRNRRAAGTSKAPLISFVLICASLAAGLAVSFASSARSDCIARLIERKSFTAVAIVEGMSGERTRLRLLEVNGEKLGDVSALAYMRTPCETGDEVRCRMWAGYENEYSSAAGDRVSYYARIDEVYSVESQRHPVLETIGRLRAYVKRSVYDAVEGDAGKLAVGMITGEKNEVPTALRVAFQRAGVSHMLVVSGLHISVLLGTLLNLLKKAGVNGRAEFFVALAASVALSAIYGFTPSVLRASFMPLMAAAAPLVGRRSDSLTSLSLAAALITAVNPRLSVNASFLLSFCCCVAILAVFPRVREYMLSRFSEGHEPRGFARELLGLFTVSCCITFVTLPLLAAFGMPASPVSPFSNLIVITLLPAFLTLIVLVSVFSSLPFLFGLAGACGFLTTLVGRALIVACRFFASFSLAAFETTALYFRVWTGFAALITLLLMTLPKGTLRARTCACALLFSLLCGSASKLALTYGKPELILYYNDSVVLRDESRCALVLESPSVDSLEYLASFLRMRLIRSVDYVIITDEHASRAAIARARELFLDADVRVAGNDETVLKSGSFAVSASNDEISADAAGCRTSVTQPEDADYGLSISVCCDSRSDTVLMADDGFDASREDFYVYRYGDTVSVLFSGDGEYRITVE